MENLSKDENEEIYERESFAEIKDGIKLTIIKIWAPITKEDVYGLIAIKIIKICTTCKVHQALLLQ